jgi:hypothetical protein
VLLYGLKEMVLDVRRNETHEHMHFLKKSKTSIDKYGPSADLWSWTPARLGSEEAGRGLPRDHREAEAPDHADRAGDPVSASWRRTGLLRPSATDLRQQIVWVDQITHSLTPQQYISNDHPQLRRSLRAELELRKAMKLKPTREEAVANRDKLNPYTWFLARVTRPTRARRSARAELQHVRAVPRQGISERPLGRAEPLEWWLDDHR